MDTSDPQILFDAQGVCNHCHAFAGLRGTEWFPNEEGGRRWQKVLEEIKSVGANSEYDCILGLSGGVDSSYLALMVREWGLRPLVVHVDAGWNSELAVANIEAIVKRCNYDLYTYVVNWEEMRDLHLAYLKAGVANQDVPQDHIFFSGVYRLAISNGIRYVLSGGNLSTEGVFPRAWQASAMDSINLRAIHKRFGSLALQSYKTTSPFEYLFYYPFVKRVRTLRPLNYMPYDKAIAIAALQAEVGWKPYGRKHGESLFTKVFQNYYLPFRFGYDKRRPHFSSLIASGQMSRERALSELDKPLYDSTELELDLDYFCKKLRITRAEFEQLLEAPRRYSSEFPNWDTYYRSMKIMQRAWRVLSGYELRAYS
jgi:N-acetyl sugar amidotransferase